MILRKLLESNSRIVITVHEKKMAVWKISVRFFLSSLEESDL